MNKFSSSHYSSSSLSSSSSRMRRFLGGGALVLCVMALVVGPQKIWAQMRHWMIGPSLPPIDQPSASTNPFPTDPSGPNPTLPPLIHQSGSTTTKRTEATQAGLRVTTQLGSDIVSNQNRTAYLLVTLEGDAVEHQLSSYRERAPLDLALVLDRSGSMSGPKLESVKSALIQMASLLSPQDHVTLVVYDDKVETLLSGQFNREKFVTVVSGVTSGGSTYLEGGLRRGLESVRTSANTGSLKKVILLSDGLANVGISDSTQLATLTKQLAGDTISVTTIGVGADYDERLMSQVALAGRGKYYFLEGPGDASRIFTTEFDELLNIVARDIRVNLGLSSGWSVRRSLGYTQIEGISFRPQPVTAGHQTQYLFELQAPAIATEEQLKQSYLRSDLAPYVPYMAEVKVDFISNVSGKAQILRVAHPQPSFTNTLINPLADTTVYKAFMDAYVAAQLWRTDEYLEKVENDAARSTIDETLKEMKSAEQRAPGTFSQDLQILEKRKEYLQGVGGSNIQQTETGRLFKKTNQYDSFNRQYNK